MKPKKMIKNAPHPKGFWGKLMLNAMNKGHASLSEWGLSFLPQKTFTDACDVGSGGGANVKRLTLLCEGKVYGIDPSNLALKESAKLCRKEIKAGKVEFLKGTSSSLPFADGSLSLVTAFETVYFWEDISLSFKEIHRALYDGGFFLIVNELSENEPDKYAELKKIIDITIYSPEKLSSLLKIAGFSEIFAYTEKDWICLLAVK